MSKKGAELAHRRESLVAKSASQREDLARALMHLRRPARLVWNAVRMIKALTAYPALVMGLAALLTKARRRRRGKLSWFLPIARLVSPSMGRLILRHARTWWSK